MGRSVAPPPGWYRDAGGALRWWDGSAWTEQVAAPAPFAVPLRRRPWTWVATTGTVLLVGAGLLTFVAGLALMGDPYPVSRAGVAATAGGLAVVNAVCPGERLVEITLRRRTDAGPSEVLWQILGDAPMPDEVIVGSEPAGMDTVTPLGADLSGSGALSLLVMTSELTGPYAMEFELADVPSSGVLRYGHVNATGDDFAAAALRDTPCGDPYSRRGVERFAAIVLASAGAAALLGVGLLVGSRRRREPRPERLRFPPG